MAAVIALPLLVLSTTVSGAPASPTDAPATAASPQPIDLSPRTQPTVIPEPVAEASEGEGEGEGEDAPAVEGGTTPTEDPTAIVEPPPPPPETMPPYPEVATEPRAAEVAPIADVTEATPEEDTPSFDRRGFSLSGSVGIASCAQLLCALMKVGGSGRLELGIRRKYVAAVVGTSIGGAQIDLQDLNEEGFPDFSADTVGSFRFFEVGAGVQVFPVARGRVDPFITAMLGYSQVSLRIDDGETDLDSQLRRGAGRLGTGLAIYVSEHIALGPRFDVTLPFAGRSCDTVNGEPVTAGEHECVDVSVLWEDAPTKADERLIRRDLPRPWSLAVDLRVVF